MAQFVTNSVRGTPKRSPQEYRKALQATCEVYGVDEATFAHVTSLVTEAAKSKITISFIAGRLPPDGRENDKVLACFDIYEFLSENARIIRARELPPANVTPTSQITIRARAADRRGSPSVYLQIETPMNMKSLLRKIRRRTGTEISSDSAYLVLRPKDSTDPVKIRETADISSIQEGDLLEIYDKDRNSVNSYSFPVEQEHNKKSEKRKGTDDADEKTPNKKKRMAAGDLDY